VLAFHWF